MGAQAPEVTLNIVAANALVPVSEQRVLFVGQFTDAGTNGVLVENIGIAGQEDQFFGRDSLLAGMLRNARKVNPQTQFDAIGLADNGTSAAATSQVAFTGSPTFNGSVTVYVGSALSHAYELDMESGDSALSIAAGLIALINADLDAPFTAVAGSTDGEVDITASNTGTTGNSFLLRVEGSVTGLSVALTGWANGSGDPVLTGLFDVADGTRYQTVVYPGSFDLNTLSDFLDPRWNPENTILDGVGTVTQTDTLANLEAAALGQDSQSVVIEGNKPVSRADYIGGHLQELNDNISSQLAAIRSLRLTQDANLSSIVTTTTGSNDLIGGPSLSTLPYFNSPFVYLAVSLAGDGWSNIEKNELLSNGISTIIPDDSRTGMVCGEVVTTYLTNGAGNDDDSYHYLNSVDAASTGREYQANNLRSRYSQSRLTQGVDVANLSFASETSIRAFLLTLYQELADLGIYQKGPVPYAAFESSLVVEVDLTAGGGSVTISESPPLVGQMRTIQGTIQIDFGEQ